jgi:thioredoxin reductase (NADPH)
MATGFGEAPSVINSALLRIYPEKRQPAHSTQLIKKFEAAQDN